MNHTEKLITKHFEKKQGDNIEALRERYEVICTFHEDPLSAALLATSFYGMEELRMRLPRLNEMLTNPFGQGQKLHALTGLIMMADGGPAEGAKAMQIYMALSGIVEFDTTKQRHLLALLSIACNQALPVAQTIKEAMETGKSFESAAEDWLRAEQKSQEESLDDTSMAYGLLVGMREEMETLFDEEL